MPSNRSNRRIRSKQKNQARKQWIAYIIIMAVILSAIIAVALVLR